MTHPKLIMKKVWCDVDFFEVNLKLISESCTIILDFYSDNSALNELREGLVLFGNQLGRRDFTWISGDKIENTTHFLSLRFFLQEKRGVVAIEVNVDNRLEPPESMIANFYLLTEINQLDDLVIQLECFIKEEIEKIEAIN